MTAGQLARFNAYVALCIEGERDLPEHRRRVGTLLEARAYAHSIGIPPAEIEAAVEKAITQAEAAV